jgi:hypothetical protein
MDLTCAHAKNKTIYVSINCPFFCGKFKVGMIKVAKRK